MPLAVEKITDHAMWEHFAKIVLTKEHQMPASKYFQNCADFAWAFSKVNYIGDDFWKFIEEVFQTELEKLKVEGYPTEQGMTTLSTICYAI